MFEIGSIPACAGEPVPCYERRSTHDPAVYPRVCGGTSTGCPLSRLSGSRSIPACAGEPEASSSRRRCRAVYPRVCGGTASKTCKVSLRHGLSLRVRGNLHGIDRDGTSVGSIPACAGEPGNATATEQNQEVYPRVCGGTLSLMVDVYEGQGLSPRVRGNPG